MKEVSNEPKKEKKIVGKLWPLMLCLVLAAGAFVFLLSMEAKELAKYERGYAVVALTDIKEHTEITTENLTELFVLEERPLTDIPEAAYVSTEELVGQYVQHDIDSGIIISKKMLGALVKSMDDSVLLSINMEALDQSVAGTLRAGDRVDIYTVDMVENEEIVVDKVMGNVGIIRSYTSAGTSILKEDDTSIAQYIIIPVHKEAVEGFYKALENRKIEIVKHPD